MKAKKKLLSSNNSTVFIKMTSKKKLFSFYDCLSWIYICFVFCYNHKKCLFLIFPLFSCWWLPDNKQKCWVLIYIQVNLLKKHISILDLFLCFYVICSPFSVSQRIFVWKLAKKSFPLHFNHLFLSLSLSIIVVDTCRNLLTINKAIWNYKKDVQIH